MKKKKYNLKKRLIAILVLIIFYVLYWNSPNVQFLRNFKTAADAEKQGNYDKAEQYYKKAIKNSSERNFDSIFNLGNLYLMEGRASDSEILFKKALEIQQKRYKKNSPEVINSMINLAKTYTMEEQYEKAEAILNEALVLTPEADMKLKSYVLATLGGNYLIAKDYKNSEKFMLRAIEFKKKIYNINSSMLIGSYIDLIHVYHFVNKPKEEKILKQSIKICETNQDCTSDQLISLYMNMTALYIDKKNAILSRFYANKASKIYSSIDIEKNQNPINKISFLINSAAINYAQGNMSKSKELSNEALSLCLRQN